MASDLPPRLLSYTNGNFEVLKPPHPDHTVYDIVSYRWGEESQPYNCGIQGITWDVKIDKKKIEDIKGLMKKENVQYLWADCVCLTEGSEIPKMYGYYKNARNCYILMDMDEVWKPQDIVNDLHFLGHVLAYMGGAGLASEAKLTENLTSSLSRWADENFTKWAFRMDRSKVQSAGIDLGVLNCYSTCVHRVSSVFENPYFSRVWTFQEMLLGKNITMYGVNGESISCIGQLDTWMNLATDSQDKALRLKDWITAPRVLKPKMVDAILEEIEEDFLYLEILKTQATGINCARTDIINGGPTWWHRNHKGISNIFSAISMRPRKCGRKGDIFKGLLGVFNGLFTPEEMEREMWGDDIERISFAFFKQLSIKTGHAWTKLAMSSGKRGEWDWIPVVANHSELLTTDCFAAVVKLGLLKEKGLARVTAMTGINGVPRKYMKILLQEKNHDGGLHFDFKGCNCGRKIKSGHFSSKPIPTHDQPRDMAGDETGRTLVECATILGSIMDPGCDVVDYRRRLLGRLQPHWDTTDPNARPLGWIDRCVNGTDWERPNLLDFRVHNRTANYKMGKITGYGSRLENESTAGISCKVSVNCGCTIVAPFSLIFEAITAVEGSSLGEKFATLDEERIILKDGLGLVQVGDVGRAFDLVAFGGDARFHKNYSDSCRSTRENKDVVPKLPWPRGRALLREEFTHGIMNLMRDYGYVETGGSGNLLVCRNQPVGKYKIIGVCIDESIENKKGRRGVTVR
ncbi:MAG: hypothetical protein M1840_001163 [Geoglossum simile]|nr:MAG: hypothetical protein M1840_001163 [Geoglossum simile]